MKKGRKDKKKEGRKEGKEGEQNFGYRLEIDTKMEIQNFLGKK